MFADYMIIYVENLSESTKKATRISECSKVIGYKINRQKSTLFLYSSYKPLEIEI